MVKPKINLAPEVKININKFLGAVELKVTDFTNIASNNVPELRSSSIRVGGFDWSFSIEIENGKIDFNIECRNPKYENKEFDNIERPCIAWITCRSIWLLSTPKNKCERTLLNIIWSKRMREISYGIYIDQHSPYRFCQFGYPQATEATITCKISGFAHIIEQYVVNRRGWKLDIDNHRSNSRFLLSSTVGIGEFVWRMALFIRNDTLIVKILCECPQNNTELHMLKGCEANVEATIHSSKNDKVDRGNGSYIWSFYRDDGWDFYYYDFDSTTCTTASCEELSDPENGFVQNDSLQITASISDVREPEESMGSIDSFGIDYWTNA